MRLKHTLEFFFFPILFRLHAVPHMFWFPSLPQLVRHIIVSPETLLLNFLWFYFYFLLVWFLFNFHCFFVCWFCVFLFVGVSLSWSLFEFAVGFFVFFLIKRNMKYITTPIVCTCVRTQYPQTEVCAIDQQCQTYGSGGLKTAWRIQPNFHCGLSLSVDHMEWVCNINSVSIALICHSSDTFNF